MRSMQGFRELRDMDLLLLQFGLAVGPPGSAAALTELLYGLGAGPLLHSAGAPAFLCVCAHVGVCEVCPKHLLCGQGARPLGLLLRACACLCVVSARVCPLRERAPRTQTSS